MFKSIPFALKVVITYLAWAIFCGLYQARTIARFGFSWDEALKDTAITQFIIAIACLTINKSLRVAKPTFKNLSGAFFQVLAITAFATMTQEALLEEVIKSINYNTFLKNALHIRGFYNGLMILLISIITWFWGYFRDQQESISRKEDAERLSREAELANLRQQLQPHFLFNSLNSISALVGSQPERARNMIQQLSDFLRGTLKKDDKQLITLKEELAHLQLYLDIEKVRFGHRLETAIHASDESLSLALPSLLLQPIVENAIKFGLYDTLDDIEIDLSARKENNYLIMEVKNPFDPTTASPKKGTGFGLQSVDRRLFLVYGQSSLLTIKQDGNTFITTLKIPQLA
jgi:two-component sensor histidine kinase